jgi:hypothetical protein
MSEGTEQATGAAESELPDTWEEANVKTTGAKPETTKDDADQPEGDADETEGAEGGDNDKGDEDGPRKKSRSERLRQKNERLIARIAELESGKAPVAVADESALDAAVKSRIGEPPNEADFPDFFDYQAAKSAYEAVKSITKLGLKDSATRQQSARVEQIRELADDYQDHLAVASKAIPDLKDTLAKATVTVSPAVEIMILEAGEKAPLVAYYLAQNPRSVEKLNAMSHIEAAREIGRIEGRVSLPKNNATRAPSPVSPVKGGASPSRSLGKSMGDYERWRNSGN